MQLKIDLTYKQQNCATEYIFDKIDICSISKHNNYKVKKKAKRKLVACAVWKIINYVTKYN